MSRYFVHGGENSRKIYYKVISSDPFMGSFVEMLKLG
jgi:hypothetical protein